MFRYVACTCGIGMNQSLLDSRKAEVCLRFFSQASKQESQQASEWANELASEQADIQLTMYANFLAPIQLMCACSAGLVPSEEYSLIYRPRKDGHPELADGSWFAVAKMGFKHTRGDPIIFEKLNLDHLAIPPIKCIFCKLSFRHERNEILFTPWYQRHGKNLEVETTHHQGVGVSPSHSRAHSYNAFFSNVNQVEGVFDRKFETYQILKTVDS